ncbi:MAG: hypothetical protein LBV46_01515, partial [Bacteroidales bacterium]|nr:hypothetical protein [Bacteroidales bacterium]
MNPSSKPLLLALILFLCGFSSCKHIGQNGVFADNPNWFHAYYQYNNKDYYKFFSEYLQSEEAKNSPFYSQIVHYYNSNQDTPFWTANGYQEALIAQNAQLLEEAFKTHGIPAEYLDYKNIRALIDTIRSGKVEQAEQLYTFLTQLEWQLTNSNVRYANALQFGATDPAIVNGGKWLYPTLQADSAFINHTLASLSDLSALFDSIAPKNHDYIVLQKELTKYVDIQDSVFKKIDKKELIKGVKSSQVPLIVNRLRLTGELPAHFQDSTLSPTLLAAINLFRDNNAIPESDKLDIETIEALNRDFDYYINRIIVNMERLRWKLEKPKESHYVAVNFADFTLKTVLADTIAIQMKVCCGRPRPQNEKAGTNSKGMIPGYKAESPMLGGSMHQLILFPEWSVPSSIMKDEYYYKLSKNCQSVLDREKMYLVDSKRKEVDPATIDWK